MKVFGRLVLCAVIMALPACHQASRVTSPSPPATTDLVAGTGTLINTGECRAWHIQARLRSLARADQPGLGVPTAGPPGSVRLEDTDRRRQQ